MEAIYQNINFLLRELFIVKQKYDYKYEQEEKFNVFTALHKRTDERRLHSRFLSVLLNPIGSHGKGNLFLTLFLKQVKIDDLGKLENIKVLPDELNKSEYRNIDIFIYNELENKALIIENKINHGDSNSEEDGQLERYYNRIKEEENYGEVHTIYLTLDGREPSDESLGTYTLEDISGQCIAYGNEILSWLKECLKHTTESPFIRETIIQYKNLLEEMTQNELDIKHQKELVEVIGRNATNMEAAKQLFENYKHIKWHTVGDFWYELAVYLEQENFEIIKKPKADDITNVTHYESYRSGQKNKQYFDIAIELENKLQLTIGNQPEEWLYIGCFAEKNKKFNESAREILGKENDITINSNDDWIFWKDLFDDENKRIYFSDFTHEGTFNLINKEYRIARIQEIVAEVKSFAAILEEI